MTTPEEMQQQTENWHNYRRAKLGSSDSAVTMLRSPWATPYQLWQEKLGLVPRVQMNNQAISLGNAFEPVARAMFELDMGLDFEPTIKQSQRYSFMIASLDGYNAETNSVLEIKCVRSDVFDLAKQGSVHEKYMPQIQHQLYVVQAAKCYFLVAKLEQRKWSREWFIAETAVVEVLPDEAFIKEMLMAELSFWHFVTTKTPPPLTERDTARPTDSETIALFARLRDAKAKGDKNIAEIKEEAIEHCERVIGHTRVEASGVNMAKNKNGTWVLRLVDSSEAPSIAVEP